MKSHRLRRRLNTLTRGTNDSINQRRKVVCLASSSRSDSSKAERRERKRCFYSDLNVSNIRGNTYYERFVSSFSTSVAPYSFRRYHTTLSQESALPFTSAVLSSSFEKPSCSSSVASSSFSSSSSSSTTSMDGDDGPTATPTAATSSSTTTTTIDEIWVNTTNSLLHQIPVGEYTSANWMEAIETFKYWMTTSEHNRQGQMRGWELLDRFYLELKNQDPNLQPSKQPSRSVATPPMLSATELFNPFLNIWRKSIKEELTTVTGSKSRSMSSLLLPSQVSRKLHEYEQMNLIFRDEYTHGMILDVAATIAGLPSRHLYPNDGIHFAETYLQNWIQAYKERSDTGGVPKPDAIAIGCIIHGWAIAGLKEAPEMASRWLNIASSSTLNIKPNPKLYTTVLSAYANHGQLDEAQQFLAKIIHHDSFPADIGIWNTLLSAYVKHEKMTTGYRSSMSLSAAEQVEKLLQQMWDLYGEGKLLEPPDVISYSIATDAWAKQVQTTLKPLSTSSFSNKNHGQPYQRRRGSTSQYDGSDDNIQRQAKKAARRALSLLNQMKHLSKEHPALNPNTITYNSVITAFARVPGCHLDAENLLIEMIQQQERNDGDEDSISDYHNNAPKPDGQSIAMVIYGWSKVGTIDAAQRAESWLFDGMKRCGIAPTVQTYSSCINCWANVPSPRPSSWSRSNENRNQQSAQRAQLLFDKMKQEDGLIPDVITYTALISAWGRQGNPWKAEKVLEDLLYEYDQSSPDNQNLKPNTRTVSTILSAWAKQSKDRPEAAERAEMWMKRISEDYGVDPNVYSYSIVLDAWAKSKNSDSPDRARAILDHMNSSSSVRPNELTYTSVVNAYATHGRAEEAEALLMEMLDDPRLPNPDMYTFSSVLSAWSNLLKNTNNGPQSGSVAEAAKRAERLFSLMHDLYNSNVLKSPPNVVCYGNVLTCLARSSDPGAAKSAEAILRMMETSKNDNHNIEGPNLICYNNVMNAWARQAKTNDSAVVRVEALLNELEQSFSSNMDGMAEHDDKDQGQRSRNQGKSSLRPDNWSYGALMKAIALSNLPNKLDRGYDVLQRMKRMGIKPNPGIKHQILQWELEQGTS